MNENGNKYALAALKDKRASLAGEIRDLKAKVAKREESLAHVDATIRVFDPDYDVETIPTKRPRKRVKLFRHGELGRFILDALRRAGGPLGTQEIVTDILKVQGHDESARRALAPRVRGNLAYLEGRKMVEKSGRGMAVKWCLLGRH